MNERIKLLAEQASHQSPDGYPVTIPYSNDFVKKFAELIVEDTVNILKQEWYDLNNLPSIANESPRDIGLRVGKKGEIIVLMEKIKQHFGVE